MPRSSERWSMTACLEAQERKNNKKDIKKNECNGTISTGLKSHLEGLLPHEENGKCDAAKHCAEFPSIGNHSPEQQVNQKWPYRDVTLQSQAET